VTKQASSFSRRDATIDLATRSAIHGATANSAALRIEVLVNRLLRDDHARNRPRWDPTSSWTSWTTAPWRVGMMLRRRNVRYDTPLEGTMESSSTSRKGLWRGDERRTILVDLIPDKLPVLIIDEASVPQRARLLLINERTDSLCKLREAS